MTTNKEMVDMENEFPVGKALDIPDEQDVELDKQD